jgi:hypothetical protein
LEIGIVLPSGHNADQRLSHPPAPKVRMNRNVDPGSASKIDPLDGCVVTPLVSPAERIEVAQPG